MLQFGHACLRVETPVPVPGLIAGKRLQFGHACLRVETPRSISYRNGGRRFNSATPACAWRLDEPASYGRKFAVASIRPRLLARGDMPISSRRFMMASLQFGHACLRVETRIFLLVGILLIPLQFGHACLRVETRTPITTTDRTRSLQFGHACLRVETRAVV